LLAFRRNWWSETRAHHCETGVVQSPGQSVEKSYHASP
jgi:hypothetical protein